MLWILCVFFFFHFRRVRNFSVVRINCIWINQNASMHSFFSVYFRKIFSIVIPHSDSQVLVRPSSIYLPCAYFLYASVHAFYIYIKCMCLCTVELIFFFFCFFLCTSFYRDINAQLSISFQFWLALDKQQARRQRRQEGRNGSCMHSTEKECQRVEKKYYNKICMHR